MHPNGYAQTVRLVWSRVQMIRICQLIATVFVIHVEMNSEPRRVLIIYWDRVLRALFALLISVQVFTYYWYAESVAPRAALRQLHDFKRRDQKYVVLNPREWAKLSLVQKAALLDDLKTFDVYYSTLHVPEMDLHLRTFSDDDEIQILDDLNSEHIGDDRRQYLLHVLATGNVISGLKNGAEIGCALEEKGFFWMKSSASGWIGELGGEWRSDVYVWVLGFWVQIYNLDEVVS
jgi:hypothetical protein